MGITDTDSERGHSRRRVLGSASLGAASVTLGGCGLFGEDPQPAPPPDPLTELLGEAVALAAAYDEAIVSEPELRERLTPLADAHRAHAAELTRVIGPAAGSAASAAPSRPAAPGAGTSLVALRRAEQAAQRTATTLGRQAPAARAALVGSIAAARAGHAEALR